MIVHQITRVLQDSGAGHLRRLCEAASLSRATYYRLRGHPDTAEPEADVELRSRIQQVALKWSAYGYRRITAELVRQGTVVNHKLVLRLMRQDNLLCLRKRRSVFTTDSAHGLPIYPNLAATRVVTAVNQLWVSDLTYIRLRGEFVYLAVVLDGFSRRVIGWELGHSLEADLAISALRKALASREIKVAAEVARPHPLLHHSDRGVQYASLAYTGLLEAHGITISMSRRATPTDNAKAESFMKTLKYEEVLVNEYRSMAEARHSISDFLDRIYNEERLHSALGYCPPVEFEQALLQPSTTP